MLNYDAPRHPVPTALYRVELVQIEKNMPVYGSWTFWPILTPPHENSNFFDDRY